MMKLIVGDKIYKIKFGFNSFCDTDLMDRVNAMMQMFSDTENDSDVAAVGKVKDMFVVVRELLYVGFAKYNPVDTLQEVGEILDDWMDEEDTDEERGLLKIFNDLTSELFNEGFLGGLTSQATAKENGIKAPTDHKRK